MRKFLVKQEEKFRELIALCARITDDKFVRRLDYALFVYLPGSVSS